MLRRYRSDPSHVVQAGEIEVSDNLSYVEEPVQILDRKQRQLRNREIPMVKVLWKNHAIEEATWETEEYMRQHYPHLFSNSGKGISGTKFFQGGENCNNTSQRHNYSCMHSCTKTYMHTIDVYLS